VGGREVGAVASGFVQRKLSLMLMRSDINGVCVTQWCSLLGDKPKCSGQALSSIFRILDCVTYHFDIRLSEKESKLINLL